MDYNVEKKKEEGLGLIPQRAYCKHEVGLPQLVSCYSILTLCDLSTPNRKFHKKLGQQAWLVAAITVTEFLIVVKYDPNTIMLPIPFFVTQCWFLGIFLILSWTLWRFFIR